MASSGLSQPSILPGLSRPQRVGLALEREVAVVDLLHAALLEREGVRVEDRAAVVLVVGG